MMFLYLLMKIRKQKMKKIMRINQFFENQKREIGTIGYHSRICPVGFADHCFAKSSF